MNSLLPIDNQLD